MIKCAREDCDIMFTPQRHNMIYHDPECRKISTSRRIMDNYYENKKRRAGKKRYCRKCGKTLSRYNPDKVCNVCQEIFQTNITNSISAMVASVEWQ